MNDGFQCAHKFNEEQKKNFNKWKTLDFPFNAN